MLRGLRGPALLGIAGVVGAGLLVALDRLGDREAWEAAETYLRQAEGVLEVTGPEPAVAREGGAVVGGELATWRGWVRSGGRGWAARVILNRGGGTWSVRDARLHVEGEWRHLVVAVDSLRGEPGPLPPITGDGTPTREVPLPVLIHPFVLTVADIARAEGVPRAVAVADSVARQHPTALAPVVAATQLLGTRDDAAAAADRMYGWIRRNPGQVQAIVLYSRYLYRAGRHEEAHRAGDWAVRTGPANGQAYYERAQAARRLWGRERSWRDYAKACELGLPHACSFGQRPTPR